MQEISSLVIVIVLLLGTLGEGYTYDKVCYVVTVNLGK